MRCQILLLSGLLVAGVVGIGPANAGWSCSGPEVACSSQTAVKLGASDAGEAKTSRHKAHFRHSDDEGAVASHTRKRHAKKAVAQASDVDDAPRAKHKRHAKAQHRGGGSDQSGVASYYHEPQRLASGGWFNPNAMTAAHRTLPFGTKVRVTHSGSGRSVVVTINDRGPYIGGRIIDLSAAAAGAIGMKGSGVAHVDVAILGR